MVNRKRVQKKVPSLLIDDVISKVENEYRRIDYQWERLRRGRPSLFFSLNNDLVDILETIKRACEIEPSRKDKKE